MKKWFLVIDDDETFKRLFRQVIQQKFTEHDIHVFSESSTAGVVKGYKRCPPCAIFLDIDLGGENGLDALQDIKQAYPLSEIVICSGQITPEDVLRSRSLGATAIYRKQHGLTELVKIIEAFITICTTWRVIL